MGERFLVVLDTTNRPEVTDRALQGGLKNIYFVYAQTTEDAKNLVSTTFRHRPDILDQIKWSMTATPLSRIAPHVTESHPAWSYIPFQKGMRAPGQQSVPPSQAINYMNPDEIIPMQVPPAPITPPTLNDTPKIAEIDLEARGTKPVDAMAAFASPTLPNGQPNPMAAFMSPTLPDGQPNPMFAVLQTMAQAMSQTMAANATPAAPAKPPVATVTRGDPDNDPDLAARLAEVRSTAVARHQNSDPEELSEEMSHAEVRASQEVEKFKMLDKSEQREKGLTTVSNDVDPALMGEMMKVMSRMGATKPDDTPKRKK